MDDYYAKQQNSYKNRKLNANKALRIYIGIYQKESWYYR